MFFCRVFFYEFCTVLRIIIMSCSVKGCQLKFNKDNNERHWFAANTIAHYCVINVNDDLDVDD